MQETTEQKKKRFKIAKELFTDLLNPKNPEKVQTELKEKIKLCEDEIERAATEKTSDINKEAEVLTNKGIIKPKIFQKQERESKYSIWGSKGRGDVVKSVVENLEKKNQKGELDILVDESGIVYFNGSKVDELKKAQILYAFLIYFLKNKGVGGTYENLFFKVWPQGKENPNLEFNDFCKKNVIRMKNRLNTLFKNKKYKLEEIRYEYYKYRLPEDFEFYVIEKIC